MLALLAGVFVVHITATIILFVSTIGHVWVVLDALNAPIGFWKNWTSGDGYNLSYENEDALKTVQVFMILLIISFGVFMFQLFAMDKGNLFFLGATLLVCWLCVMNQSVHLHSLCQQQGKFWHRHLPWLLLHPDLDLLLLEVHHWHFICAPEKEMRLNECWEGHWNLGGDWKSL